MESRDNVTRIRSIKYLKPPTSWSSCNSQLQFSVTYVGVKRNSNSAGASLPKTEYVITEYRIDPSSKSYRCGNDLIYEGGTGKTGKFNYWDKTPWHTEMTPQILNLEKDFKCQNPKICNICYREEFTASIEINPEIFDRGYLKIPSEGDRFARTPMEALIYIILHEMGHVEAHLSKESRCWINYSKNLTKQDNSEESAWEFASSVMHYEEDVDAVSVFEQCINDMPNRFKNLKQDRLENRDLPDYYAWSTTLPVIKVSGLEFTPRILEAKYPSKGIGVFWSWGNYKGERPIEWDKARSVANEIEQALSSNKIYLRFDFEVNNIETKEIWTHQKNNDVINMWYLLGKKGNPDIPEGKVSNIDIMFYKVQ